MEGREKKEGRERIRERYRGREKERDIEGVNLLFSCEKKYDIANCGAASLMWQMCHVSFM